MSRYIDIEPLIKGIELSNSKVDGSQFAKGYNDAIITILRILKAIPHADVVEIPEGGIGNLSDGYHTFNELYHHRAILFSVICNSMPDKAWKSKLHDTGDMFDGMFIVGIETPEGQATYHYDIDPYWELFKVKEFEKAPKYDGHTPQDAIDRISKLSADVEEVRHGRWIYVDGDVGYFESKCSVCNKSTVFLEGEDIFSYCPNCGAKMDGERREENI